MLSNEDLIEHLTMNIESSADWRRRIALEYPEDEARNLEAAGQLEKQAKLFENYQPGSEFDAYKLACMQNGDATVEAQSELTGSLHFSVMEPAAFVEAITR